MALSSIESHKSSIRNTDANIIAIMAYLAAGIIGWIPIVQYLSWIIPLLIFLTEKQSKFVKFHAVQSFIITLIDSVISFILIVIIRNTVIINAIADMENTLGAFAWMAILTGLATVVSLIYSVFAIIALVNAYQYKLYKIPVIGSIAEKIAAKKG
ncbi:MAG TPA: hypothetical protein DCM45_07845 [Clostridiales bacterium]|nr:hypothetical protein [Clostridiales bacterium]